MLSTVLVWCLFGVVTAIPTPHHTSQSSGKRCGYESCTRSDPEKLNVHIVPHTHDDVGWLKTVDQYYYGSRNNIQKAGVQYILDSVVKELWEDPKRRFIYVETAFFWKWWVRQSGEVKKRVHTLVEEGRLQFVGGAWSMNDEAAVHYQTTIDQFTWGLKKLNDTFGECGIPRVGWQIDPFGHSREFASLLAGMGYDGLFLGRLDYQDKSVRKRKKSMEMVWRGDDVLGKSSDIFTGVLYNTYSPPPGFCFDVLCNDEPIIDDPDSPIYNVEKRISDFLTYVTEQSKYYRTNNVIVTMGGDFTYQDATMWYTNLDKLILYTNMKADKDRLNITLFYSTPDCYLKAVKDANPTLPTKQDDFFPYASDPTAYWTGYFTSRPTTKYFEREGNNYLQVAKQLQVLANLEKHNMFVLNELKSAMGVMQHHDAVTGTEKQHVTHDYERLLDQAVEDSLIIPRQALNKMTQGDELKPAILNLDRCKFNESSCFTTENGDNFVVTVYNPLAWQVKEPIRVPVVLQSNDDYEVYEPSGQKIVSQIIDIPAAVKNIPTRVSTATHEVIIMPIIPALGYTSFYMKKTTKNPKTKRELNKVENKNNDVYDINSHTQDINDYWKDIKEKTLIQIRNIEDTNVHETENDKIKREDIPDQPKNLERKVNNNKIDLGVLKNKGGGLNPDVIEFEKLLQEEREHSKIHVRKSRIERVYPNLNDEEMRMLSDEPRIVEMYSDDDFTVKEKKQITYNEETNRIDYNGLQLGVEFHYYPGCSGNNENYANRSSGAYIFRPNATAPVQVKLTNEKTVSGPIVHEVRLSGQNLATTIRIYEDFVELDAVVGPINIDDDIGKEYVVKYVTDIVNNGEFYTDSNSRQMLKRKLNKRPQWNVTLDEPIAGNYYPVTSMIHIEDNDPKKTLTIFTDRAEGGTSLVEGQIELMLHRRLMHDDAFGVGEALNETANGVGLVARITHRVLANSDINKPKFALQASLHPRVFISDAKNVKFTDWLKFKNEHSWLKADLPDGIHLLTLEPWGKNLLIRLENIQETPGYLTVDLDSILNNIKIKTIKETTLAVNQWLKDYKKWEWNKESSFAKSFNDAYGSFDDITTADDVELIYNDEGSKINLKSKQIRTFIVEYDYVTDV